MNITNREYGKRKNQNRKYKINQNKNKIYDRKFELIINIRNLLNENKLPFAYDNIMNYFDTYGEDCYIIHEYGKFLYMDGKLNEAREQFGKNINNNSKNKYYSMYELSKVERLSLNYNKAIDLLKQILESKHKEKIHAKFELAKIYIEIYRIKEAKELLKDILQTEEKGNTTEHIKDSIWRYLLECELGSNNCDEALLILNNYKNIIKPYDYDIIRSEIELERKNYIEAKQLLEDNLLKYPQLKIRILHDLSLVEYGLMNYYKTIDICNQLLDEGNYYYEDTLVTQTNTYIKLNHSKEAFENIQRLMNAGHVNVGILLTGKLYFYINNYEKAIEYLNKVEDSHRKIYREALYLRICSYIKLKKYNDAYELLPLLEKKDFNNGFSSKSFIIKCFLEKQLCIYSDIKTTNYSALQIINYDKETAIEHIKNHDNYDDNKFIYTIFNENVNIEKLYSYCKNSLSESNFIKNTFYDTYIIPYDNVGILEGKTINYVKVIVIPNTKDILSIYPYDNLIYPTLENEKTKRLSRVEKFNKKYGINKKN